MNKISTEKHPIVRFLIKHAFILSMSLAMVFTIYFSQSVNATSGTFLNGAGGTVVVDNTSVGTSYVKTVNTPRPGNGQKDYMIIRPIVDLNGLTGTVSSLKVGLYESGTTTDPYVEKAVNLSTNTTVTLLVPPPDISAEEWYANVPTDTSAGNLVQVIVTDTTGKIYYKSDQFKLFTYTASTIKPILTQVTAVPNPTTNTNPTYKFRSTKSGNITYGGSCSSSISHTVIPGDNTITFDTFGTVPPATYGDCTILVSDPNGVYPDSWPLLVSSFAITSSAGPTLTEVTPVTPSSTNDTTPDYTFKSTEAGDIMYSGSCSSSTKTILKDTNTTITLGTNANPPQPFSPGFGFNGVQHNDCNIVVKGSTSKTNSVALHISNFIILPPLTPEIYEVSAVNPNPSIVLTPEYSFSSTVAGDIVYGGSCITDSNYLKAIQGVNVIKFGTLTVGTTYSNCTIKVKSGQYESNILSVPSFSVAAGGSSSSSSSSTSSTSSGSSSSSSSGSGSSSTSSSSSGSSSTSSSSSGSSSGGSKVDAKIENPLGDNFPDLPSFIVKLLNIVLMIGVPIVVLAIIYCGFLFVKAMGNPEEISKAKNALLYTVIGAALLLGCFVLANAIAGTVAEISKGV